MAKIILFLRDAVSLGIYISIFLFKRKRNVTLVYHSIGQVSSENDPYKLTISPKNFENHLKAISKYKGKVSITFDDGYENNFKYAFPLLKKYGLRATFFVVTDFINGRMGSEIFGGENFKENPLTWDEISVMDKAGMGFGSHSKTHRILANISADELEEELSHSKIEIEKALGHKIEGFAYPRGCAGSFNRLTEKTLADNKYSYAYSNIMGCNHHSDDTDNKFVLRRVRIYGEDGPAKLKMKLAGAYDWIDIVNGMIHNTCAA